MAPIKLSVITNNVHAKLCECTTLDELSTLITSQDWAPSTFKESYRKKENFEATSLMALDVDEGCTLEEAKQIFSGYQHLIATTRSHGKEKNGVVADRFRVVLLLTEPITDSLTYSATWHECLNRWPFIDDKCKDPSRMYFKSVEVVSSATEGATLNVVYSEPDLTSGPGLRALPTPGAKGRLARATLEFMVNGAPDGEWNQSLFKAAKDFQEQGYTFEEAFSRLSNMSNPHYSGALDSKDRDTIGSAFNGDPKYEARTNFPVMKPGGRNAPPYPDPRHPDNVKYLIEEVCGFKPGLNELKQLITIEERNPESGAYEVPRPIHDRDLSTLRVEAAYNNFATVTEAINDNLEELATTNTYHPAKHFIESTPWDNTTDHISALFNTFILEEGTPDDLAEQYKTYLQRWLIGAVAKIYSPGSQNLVFILQGSQGSGKSRWLSRLEVGEGTKGEGMILPGKKDHDLRHLTYNIWVCDELDAVTRKKDVSDLKAYFTQERLSIRPAYARHPIHGVSQCSFCGSVNEDSFLSDLTGNRRYLIVPVKAADADHSVNMQQVWAQALHLYQNGHRWWFEGAEVTAINEANEEYGTDNYLIRTLTDYTEPGDDFFTVAEIIRTLWPDLQYVDWQYRTIKNALNSRASKGAIRRGRQHRCDKLKATGYPVNRQRVRGYFLNGDRLRAGAPGGMVPSSLPSIVD